MNARETLIEFDAILAAGIYARNTTLEELFGTGQDVDKARDFNDSMPSTRVAVSLKAHYHRDITVTVSISGLRMTFTILTPWRLLCLIAMLFLLIRPPGTR